MSSVSAYQAKYSHPGYKYRMPEPIGTVRSENHILGQVAPLSIFNRSDLSRSSERALNVFKEQRHSLPQSFKCRFSDLDELNEALSEIESVEQERMEEVAVLRAQHAAKRSQPASPGAGSVQEAQGKGLLPQPKEREVVEHKSDVSPMQSGAVMIKVIAFDSEALENISLFVERVGSAAELVQRVKHVYPHIIAVTPSSNFPVTFESRVEKRDGIPCIYAPKS